MAIYNSTNVTFQPSTQQVIENAMANMGIDEVYVGKDSHDGGQDTLFNLFDENDNYLFSIDLDGDVIYSN